MVRRGLKRTFLFSVALLLILISCTDLPTSPMPEVPLEFRGITIASWSRTEYQQPETSSQVGMISATGANFLSILVTAYQSSTSSNSIRLSDSRTPSDFALERCAQMAMNNGLNVVFKPHVNTDDGTWSGNIMPDDPEQWFGTYREFVLAQASLAEETGSSLFMVGTELGRTMVFETEWRELISEIRDIFSGELVYAASWDEVEQVPFWDALDYVGVNFYYPVARRNDPGRVEILAGWQPWLERIERIHEDVGRPVILTEIGYRSIDGAGIAPHDFNTFGRIDLDEQADLYWAALQAVSDQPHIVGMFWWNWLAAGSGGYNAEYSPAGKPAEAVLQEAWLSQ